VHNPNADFLDSLSIRQEYQNADESQEKSGPLSSRHREEPCIAPGLVAPHGSNLPELMSVFALRRPSSCYNRATRLHNRRSVFLISLSIRQAYQNADGSQEKPGPPISPRQFTSGLFQSAAIPRFPKLAVDPQQYLRPNLLFATFHITGVPLTHPNPSREFLLRNAQPTVVPIDEE
jgi:hypothetical protein